MGISANLKVPDGDPIDERDGFGLFLIRGKNEAGWEDWVLFRLNAIKRPKGKRGKPGLRKVKFYLSCNGVRSMKCKDKEHLETTRPELAAWAERTMIANYNF